MGAGIDWGAPFFDGGDSLYNVAVTIVVLYPVMVVLIRLAGKRSVSKMNNFDWIVTVALGSVVASAAVFDSVTIADALLALALLLGLQWALTRVMTRSSTLTDMLISTPTLLLHDGRVIREALARERVTEAELFAAIRAAGHSDPRDCYAVVLESNAEMTVIAADPAHRPGAAMADVPALRGKADGDAYRDGPPKRAP